MASTMNNNIYNPLIDEITNRLNWLASYGKDSDGGITRLLYSSSWLAAQKGVKHWMDDIGFTTSYDSVGNLFGRLPAKNASADTILTGSHIDTVKNGGKYDGAYGIVASILALRYLKETYGPPNHHLELASLCEEEGSRFPITYWGSGNITGTLSLTDANDVRDAEGSLLTDAMHQAGFGFTGGKHHCRRDDLKAFIELHVEQGNMLEHTNQSIGIVDCIVAQKRFTFEVSGETNHAGTTPMTLRKDAVTGATEMIQCVMTEAERYAPPLVTTVGKIDVQPNTPNVIAGKVTFSIDARHPDEKILESFCEHFLDYFEQISVKQQLSLTTDCWMSAPSADMHPHLVDTFEAVCQEHEISFDRMASGAGHDSQIFAPFCPTALLFVPSHKGISHSPEEYTGPEDLAQGVNVLIDVLYKLGYEEE